MSASANPRFTFVTRARTRSPGKPAPDEDDEAVQARDAVPAVGERVDLELDLLVQLHRRGHRRRVLSGDVAAARCAPTPAAPIERDPAERDGRRRASTRAGRRRRCRPATSSARNGQIRGRRRRRRAARGAPTTSVSTTKIQMSVPTSAADLALHDRARWRRPISAHERARRAAPAPRASTTSPSAECESSPMIESQTSATATTRRAPAAAKHERDDRRRRSPSRTSTPSRCGVGEERGRDRAVPELGRDDRDPEDEREQRREARGLDERQPGSRRCRARAPAEPIVAGDADARRAARSRSGTPPAAGRPELQQLRADERDHCGRLARRSARGRPPRASRARRQLVQDDPVRRGDLADLLGRRRRPRAPSSTSETVAPRRGEQRAQPLARPGERTRVAACRAARAPRPSSPAGSAGRDG